MNKIVEIKDYTYDGLGIGKIDGFPYFVEYAGVGDVVEIEVTKMKKNLAFAKVVKFITRKSIEPVCEHFYECGGCHIMHLDYEEQLRFKTNHVTETIKRIGSIDTVVLPTIGMDNPYHYRNKLIMPYDGPLTGLYKKGSHDIVDLKRCHILNEYSFKIAQFLRGKIKLRNVLVRNAFYNDSIMVVLITTDRIETKIAEDIVKEFPRVVSVVNNVNPKKTNVILGEQSFVLYGEDAYSDQLLGIDYSISHKNFYQVNTIQTEKLYNIAINAVDLKDKTVVDAYCGIGSIGLSFAHKAKFVYGIEINNSSVEMARRNAKRNGVKNIEFVLGKAEIVIGRVISDVDVVITDPPRKGCGEGFLQSIIDNNISEIVYVSCNVSTLARDIEYLSKHYSVDYIQPVDMFPHTFHVECVAKLTKR